MFGAVWLIIILRRYTYRSYSYDLPSCFDASLSAIPPFPNTLSQSSQLRQRTQIHAQFTRKHRSPIQHIVLYWDYSETQITYLPEISVTEQQCIFSTISYARSLVTTHENLLSKVVPGTTYAQKAATKPPATSFQLNDNLQQAMSAICNGDKSSGASFLASFGLDNEGSGKE